MMNLRKLSQQVLRTPSNARVFLTYSDTSWDVPSGSLMCVVPSVPGHPWTSKIVIGHGLWPSPIPGPRCPQMFPGMSLQSALMCAAPGHSFQWRPGMSPLTALMCIVPGHSFQWGPGMWVSLRFRHCGVGTVGTCTVNRSAKRRSTWWLTFVIAGEGAKIAKRAAQKH